MVLIDTDARNLEQLTTFRENIEQLQDNLIKKNVQIYGANPEIESWIVAGLDENLYRQFEGLIQKEVYIEYFGPSTIDNTRQLMRKFNIAQAMQVSPDLAEFVGALRQYAFIESANN